jgi:hypothetical protein
MSHKTKKKEKNCETCSICLVDIRNLKSKNIIKQSCCNKPFHKKCINKWYKIKKECPLCREKQGVFTDDEINFLSNTLTNIAPIIRPLYQTYNVDSTMQNVTDVISVFSNNISNMRDFQRENNSNTHDQDLADLDEVFNSTRSMIDSIRNMMNDN